MNTTTEAAGVAGAGSEIIRTDDMLREQARAWREVFDLLCALRPGWHQGSGATTPKALATIRALAAEQARAERLELIVKQYASECGGCNGLGYIGVKYWRGDIEFDADDQPCPDCADIRAALALRPSGDGVAP